MVRRWQPLRHPRFIYECAVTIGAGVSELKLCASHLAHRSGKISSPTRFGARTPSGRCPIRCAAPIAPIIGRRNLATAIAPRRLSSEGERSPVEPLVAPLVFELKKLGVFHPCWPCEGHADQDGKLRKIPRVWFYADSVVHLRGLAEAIDRLCNRQRLSAHRQIVLTYSDAGNPDTTFSLEPQPPSPDCLPALQADLRVMAAELPDAF